MKRKVLVTINCGDKTCGRCGWYLRLGDACDLFGTKPDDGNVPEPTILYAGAAGTVWTRCRACIAAEAKAKGGGK